MIGQVFGRLTVVKEATPHVTPSGQKKKRFLCTCSCGNEVTPHSSSLLSGASQSCGCLVKENKGAPRQVELKKGDRFGNLIVIKEAEKYSLPGGTSQRRFLCKCVCGAQVEVFLSSLRNGTSKSCGCEGKHGGHGTPEYHAWEAMWQRCTNPNNPSYKDYGARGICVDACFKDFSKFLSEVGTRPSRLYSLDRRDNEKGYIPGNLWWVTRDLQNLNRRNAKLYEFKGQSLPLCKWADILGVTEKTLWSRIHVCKWPVEKALSTPKKS